MSNPTFTSTSTTVNNDPSPIVGEGNDSSTPIDTLPKKMTLAGWKKRSLTIILIGETGSGKTAFMNLLANVCAGITLENFTTVHITKNESGGSQTQSQTKEPILYTIDCADGHVINILDTPGFADTAGLEADKVHQGKIAESIKGKIEVIDAVIILTNGTQSRLNNSTEYTLTTISGMFPHSIIDNIGFVCTMVADPLSFNFQRESLPVQLRKAQMWPVNNPLAQWFKYQDELHGEAPPSAEEAEELEDSVRRGYTKTLKTLNSIFKWLDERKYQPTHGVYDLYLMSTTIEASIANVIARIGQTEEQRLLLQQLEVEYTTQAQKKKINEAYERIIQQPFYDRENTDNGHNTLCISGSCYSNCHEGCAVNFTLNADDLGDQCQAFHNGTAGGFGSNRLCDTCKHPARDHQHHRTKWVQKIKEEKQIDVEAKKKYNDADTESGKIEERKKDKQRRLNDLEQDIRELEDKLSELCEQYNNLALSGSFVGYMASAINLLKKREETMKKSGAEKDSLELMEERIKRLEEKKRVVEKADEKRKIKGKGTWWSNTKETLLGVH